MEKNKFTQFKPLVTAFNPENFNSENFNQDQAEQMRNYLIENGLTPTNKYQREYLDWDNKVAIANSNNTIPEIKNSVNLRDIISRFNPAYIAPALTTSISRDRVAFSADKKQKAKEYNNFFMGRGFTKEQAAGIVGNLYAESGLNHSIKQIGGGPGFGLAQWEGPRQADFKRVMGKDIQDSTEADQLNFIIWELENTERGAKKALLRAKTPEEAAKIFAHKYERMKTYNKEREIYARNFLEEYNKK